MRHKKLLALSLVVALSFSACGKKEENKDTTTPAPTETVTQEATPDVTEEVTPDASEEVPSDETLDPAGEIVSDATLDAVHNAAKEQLGENYIPSMPYDATTLTELFGVDPSWYDAAIAEGPMMSVHVDKFIGIHATEGNVENVANALNAYRDTLVADTMQYPMNVTKIQGSVVETVGDYVFFVMLGSLDATAYEDEGKMIEDYKAINTNVIEAAKGIIEQ